MEAKDLMIGCWVLYSYQENEKQPGRITYISENGSVGIAFDNGMEVATNLRYCEPIPLTTEILENNGFLIKHPESEKRTYLKDRAGQIVVRKNRGLLFFNISGNPWKFGWFHPAFSGHIRFVHELQHALRLCGIEKEIVI